ncbi:MAG: ABC transporter ATP-binding protein, partial [Propionibacteriaceae bacterium]|nr:ABC transporter ATP-binding protein [Propionibacteriaceae bacterium]
MTTAAIQLTGLTKTYGSLTAVDRLDLDVPAGQILAMLGPNGAGKSTTTEMIIGLTQPDAGSAKVFGLEPTTAVRAGRTGAMLQNGALLADTSVLRLLKMMHGVHARPLPLAEVIDLADVSKFLKTSTAKLSGGQAQRVRFALAIMGNPQLIILDEPTVGLDVDARRRFWQVMGDLTSNGRTVVFATHYLDEADEFADRIVVLNDGRLVADGTGTEIKQRVGGRHVSFRGPERDWRQIAAVVGVEVDGGRVTLNSSDADATLRA